MAVAGKTYDLRISTLPTADGEKIVIRILVQARANIALEELGVEPEVLASFKEVLRRPQGMILVTGPTGSGKTSTLYAALNELIRKFLAGFDIVAVSPSETLQHYTDALKMTDDDVVAYARRAIAERRPVDAIYFQGAVLDPMDCLEQMERELKIPVVASNAAMNWFTLSKLGLKHPLAGYGKLLATWPALSAN